MQIDVILNPACVAMTGAGGAFRTPAGTSTAGPSFGTELAASLLASEQIAGQNPAGTTAKSGSRADTSPTDISLLETRAGVKDLIGFTQKPGIENQFESVLKIEDYVSEDAASKPGFFKSSSVPPAKAANSETTSATNAPSGAQSGPKILPPPVPFASLASMTPLPINQVMQFTMPLLLATNVVAPGKGEEQSAQGFAAPSETTPGISVQSSNPALSGETPSRSEIAARKAIEAQANANPGMLSHPSQLDDVETFRNVVGQSVGGSDRSEAPESFNSALTDDSVAINPAFFTKPTNVSSSFSSSIGIDSRLPASSPAPPGARSNALVTAESPSGISPEPSGSTRATFPADAFGANPMTTAPSSVPSPAATIGDPASPVQDSPTTATAESAVRGRLSVLSPDVIIRGTEQPPANTLESQPGSTQPPISLKTVSSTTPTITPGQGTSQFVPHVLPDASSVQPAASTAENTNPVFLPNPAAHDVSLSSSSPLSQKDLAATSAPFAMAQLAVPDPRDLTLRAAKTATTEPVQAGRSSDATGRSVASIKSPAAKSNSLEAAGAATKMNDVGGKEPQSAQAADVSDADQTLVSPLTASLEENVNPGPQEPRPQENDGPNTNPSLLEGNDRNNAKSATAFHSEVAAGSPTMSGNLDLSSTLESNANPSSAKPQSGQTASGQPLNSSPSTGSVSKAVASTGVPVPAAKDVPTALTVAPPISTSDPQTGTEARPNLPQSHQMLDSAPAGFAPLPATGIAPGVAPDGQANSQLHVGIRTDAFGAVEIHTVLEQSQVGVTVHADRDLGRWFSAEVPGLESGLNQHHLNLTAVDFDHSRSGVQAETGFQQGQPRQHFSETPVSQPFAHRRPEEQETAEDSGAVGISIVNQAVKPAENHFSIHV